MWLGEQISERGIGNGISLIIFAGIVVGFPNAVATTLVRTSQTGSSSLHPLVALAAIMVAVVAAIVFVERAQRRIPIQYARAGRRAARLRRRRRPTCRCGSTPAASSR